MLRTRRFDRSIVFLYRMTITYYKLVKYDNGLQSKEYSLMLMEISTFNLPKPENGEVSVLLVKHPFIRGSLVRTIFDTHYLTRKH